MLVQIQTDRGDQRFYFCIIHVFLYLFSYLAIYIICNGSFNSSL